MTPESDSNADLSLGAALLRGAVLLLLPVVLYLPALRGEFAVDDHRFIVRHTDTLDAVLAAPWTAFTDPSTNAVGGDDDIYRPIRTLSFAIDHALFGLDPLGYHVHSVLLHGMAALLAWRLLRRTAGERVGFVAALLFAAHPLATEAVAWVSGRSDVEAAVLVFAALLLARRAEDGPRLWLVPVAALACFAKEPAVMLPALYGIEHRIRRGRFERAAAVPFVLLCIGVALYLLVYLFGIDRAVDGQVGYYGGTAWSHLPYGLIGVARTLRLTLITTGQHYHYEPELFHPVAGLDVSLAALGLLATVALAWRLRRTVPAVTWGVAWFLVALLPASNLILPMRTVLAERFAYLPMIGIVLGVAALLQRASKRLERGAWVAAAAVVLALSLATWQRAGDWSTRESLHRATLRSWPGSYGARIGLASALEAKGDAEGAIEHYDKAAKLPVDAARRLDALYGVGHVAMLRGDFERAVAALGEVDQALTAERSLIDDVRHGAEARYDLGYSLSRLHRLEEAGTVFDRLMADHGDTPERLDARGEIERALLDIHAIDYYQRALHLDPDYHPARIHLALVYRELPGFLQEAKRELREVLYRSPGHERAAELLREVEEQDRREREELRRRD